MKTFISSTFTDSTPVLDSYKSSRLSTAYDYKTPSYSRIEHIDYAGKEWGYIYTLEEYDRGFYDSVFYDLKSCFDSRFSETVMTLKFHHSSRGIRTERIAG